ncbi:hypothetical protein HK098_007795, partial [Nowakowskiella sp. JEL0407]
LPEGIVNGIFSRIVEVLEGHLLSPSEPAMITPAEFTADEDFDIAVLSQIQNELIPCLGKPYVPDHLTLRLAEVFRRGSRLYTASMDATGSTTTGALGKPNSTNVSTTIYPGLSEQSPIGNQNSEIVHKAQGNLDNDIGWLKIESPSLAPLGSSSSAVGSRRASVDSPRKSITVSGEGTGLKKERFVLKCLETLFGMCSDERTDQIGYRIRVAETVAPFVLEKTAQIIRLYAAERPLYGRLPMPRLRNEEVLSIIKLAGEMNIRVNILSKALADDNKGSLRSQILAGKSAHIFYLYPVLCDCLCVITKNRNEEEKLIDAIRICLSRVGRELGIET